MTLFTIFSGLMAASALLARSAHGPSWWDHLFPDEIERTANDEGPDVFWFVSRAVALCTLAMGSKLDAYLPAYYLYNALCVA